MPTKSNPKTGYIMQKKPIVLSDDELILKADFSGASNANLVRHAIWEYVENDQPIPNELKGFLLEILQQDFKGKSISITQEFWDIKVKEVIFLMEGIYPTNDPNHDSEIKDPMPKEKALIKVSSDSGLGFSTLERRFDDGKYKPIKDIISNYAKEIKQDENQ